LDWSSPASESNSHPCTQKSINTPYPEPNEFRPQLPSSNPIYQNLISILSSHLGLYVIRVHLPASLLNNFLYTFVITLNATESVCMLPLEMSIAITSCEE